MAPKGNKMIPNTHFHKDWQRYIKCWFNQPARKFRRHRKRVEKAAQAAPRPVGKLRPIVRCPGVKYNVKTRLGKGFSIQELKAVGVCKREALKIGLSIDYKRKNRSVEAMQNNIQRLQEYKSKLILFPKDRKKLKKTDSSLEECSKAKQLRRKTIVAVPKLKPSAQARFIKNSDRSFSCYNALKRERSNARTWGRKQKKAMEAAEDAAVIKK